METGHYLVRRMTRTELDLAVELAAQERWNPGLHDAECFYAADPRGFFIGRLDDEPVCSLSVVKYGKNYAFAGLYVVKPEYRHSGFGFPICQQGIESAEGRDIWLDGVRELQANYAELGFEFAYYNTRYEGAAEGGAGGGDPRIVELSDVPFETLNAYDQAVFAAPRPEFLRCWVSQPQSVALGIVIDRHFAGYAVLRQCRVGFKIGPLFADDETLAEALFVALSNRVPQGTPIFLDVPGEKENPAATVLPESHGMKAVFQTARMYRLRASKEMNLPPRRWFGVTTFELG